MLNSQFRNYSSKCSKFNLEEELTVIVIEQLEKQLVIAIKPREELPTTVQQELQLTTVIKQDLPFAIILLAVVIEQQDEPFTVIIGQQED